MDRKPPIAFRGCADFTPFGQCPDGYVPFKALRNARLYGSKSQRPRGSRRPGLRLLVAQQLKDSPVQAVLSISRASARTGYAEGTCSPMGAALSIPAAGLVGQIAALDDVPSMDWFRNLDVTAAGGPAGVDVNCCNWDPDAEFVAVSANYKVGSDDCYSVARINKTTGAVVWRADRHNAGKNVSVNNICITKLYTFVAIYNSNPAGPFIVGYRNDTGAEAISGNLGGWAREAVAMCRTVDTGTLQENLFVAFHGSAGAGTYFGGIGGPTIQFGRYASQFREGIMKFHVESLSYGGGGTVEVAWGHQKGSTDAYFENTGGRVNPINYWRYSEQGPYRPHGAVFTALRSGRDGSIYFAKCNQGWGPNNTRPEFQPDGGSEGYRTLGKINPAGVLEWTQDTDSIKEIDDLGFYNDQSFPGKATPDPSISAICVDTMGNLYAGGRQTGTGVSAFALDSAAGSPLWAANLQAVEIAGVGASIREGAASIDIDGNPWFAGDRNTAWDGSTGRQAHLWKLSKTDGSVLKFFDLAKANIGALSVAASGEGEVFYTTSYVS